jgi:hypothetical protein
LPLLVSAHHAIHTHSSSPLCSSPSGDFPLSLLRRSSHNCHSLLIARALVSSGDFPLSLLRCSSHNCHSLLIARALLSSDPSVLCFF